MCIPLQVFGVLDFSGFAAQGHSFELEIHDSGGPQLRLMGCHSASDHVPSVNAAMPPPPSPLWGHNAAHIHVSKGQVAALGTPSKHS